MRVFILGFPFGDSLAAKQTNPTITIGTGSVSSIRRDKSGKVVNVQIDGALNPGNSGGPVVDGRGNLVGIAVQTIQGSHIGMTIPAGELTSMLEGGLGKPRIAVTGAVNQAPPRYDIVVPVFDPLKKPGSVSIGVHLCRGPRHPNKPAGHACRCASRRLDFAVTGSRGWNSPSM